MKDIGHDLRLAAVVVNKSKKMKDLFRDRIVYRTLCGTPRENFSDGYYICNIVDMCKDLDFLVKRLPSISVNDIPIGIIQEFLTASLSEITKFIPFEERCPLRFKTNCIL